MGQTPDTRVKVRLCNLTDYFSIIRIAKIVVSEAYPEEEFNEDKIKQCFFRTLEDPTYFGIVLEVDGVIRGFTFLTIQELMYVKKNVCICLAIYVERRYRRHAIGLFNGMEHVAKAHQVNNLIIHKLEGLSPSGMNKFLKRLNFKIRETGYWKELV